MMSLVLIVLLWSIIFLVAAGVLMEKKQTQGMIVCGGIGILLLSLGVFAGTPMELGWSVVPDKTEEFAKRLDTGKVYYVIATDDVSGEKADSKIILVREEGSSNYRAIHVNNVFALLPHERFTLLNGQPVRIK